MNEHVNISTELPRKGSIMFDFMSTQPQQKKKTVKKFKILNNYFVVPLYRINILPLFFVGKVIVLLYTIGRKSGKRRITPVEFREYNGKILLFSSRGKKGDWFRNIINNPNEFKIKKGFRTYKPEIKVTDQHEKIEIMLWYTKTYPKAAKGLFGYQKNIDVIDEHSVKKIADFLEILQLTI